MTYRDNEKPITVKDMIEEMKRRISSAIARGADEEDLYDLYETKHELEDRLRFAYADQEADMNGWY